MFITVQPPKGTKDCLSEKLLQYKTIESVLSRSFKSWGYKEIRTPILENGTIFLSNLGMELTKNMFKFQDFDGEIVTLRPEMTIPIIRNFIANNKHSVNTKRISYFANVFRYNQTYIEREREFWQAGVELIAIPNIEDDGEILALLITSLKDIGIQEIRVDINYKNLLEEIISTIILTEEESEYLRNKIIIRDKELIELFLTKKGLSHKEMSIVLDIIDYQPLSLLSQKVNESKYVKPYFRMYFQKLIEIMEDYGYQDLIFFDITLTKEINYYSGLIFEVAVPELGIIVGTGGRYDQLLKNFGRSEVGGIGFALEIEKCAQVLDVTKSLIISNKKLSILIITRNRKAGVKLGRMLRALGFETVLQINNGDFTSIPEKDTDFDFVIFSDDYSLKELRVLEVATRLLDLVTFEDIEKILERR